MAEKKRTYYKNFHKGYSKPKGRGMTGGDIRERLGSITVQVFKSSREFFSVRDLKEILGSCGYYLTERIIRRMTNEGALKGRKFNNYFWYYTKRDIYGWVEYLKEVGLSLLIKRRIIKEEKDLDVLVRSREKTVEKKKETA